MRWKGFEPSRYCYRQPLKLVRLPVPPPPHKLSRCFCLLLGSGSPLEVAVAFLRFDCPAILRKSNENYITHFPA